jgi:hypothetical protein
MKVSMPGPVIRGDSDVDGDGGLKNFCPFSFARKASNKLGYDGFRGTRAEARLCPIVAIAV